MRDARAAAVAPLLRRAGLRVTAPRCAVIAALRAQRAPIDAIRLHGALLRTHPRLSLATVYRVLRELERQALLGVSVAPHGRMQWRWHETAAAPPPSPDPALARLARLAARHGYGLVPLAPASHAAPFSLEDSA